MIWTGETGQAKLAEFRKLQDEDWTLRQIASRYGLTRQTVKRALQRHRGTVVHKGNITFEDKRVVRPEDVARYYELLKEEQECADRLNTKQVEATILLRDTKPVGIAFTGDWHVGGKGIDYDLLDEDIDLIRTTDGMYTSIPGDLKDNFVTGSPRGANFEQAIPPGAQDDIVLNLLLPRLFSKTLTVNSGCHDAWDKMAADREFIAEAALACGAVNLWHGGVVTIRLGIETYTYRIRHKGRFESKLNTTNAHRRSVEEKGPVDIVVLGHLHNPEVGTRRLGGRTVGFVRVGSYKEWDEHGQQVDGLVGIPGVPVAILFPDEHRFELCADLRQGVERLKFLREVKPNAGRPKAA